MIQNYTNIPRQLVEFKDGGLILRNSNTTESTKSVLILGTAVDGPKDPVAIDIDTAGLLYGKDVNANGVPNGATIPKAVNEAYRAGCKDIRAMRISGENAFATINSPQKSVTETSKVDEVLGFAEGNAETTLTLANAGVDVDTLKVYVKGQMLSTTLEYTEGTKALVIPAEVTDAGANLTVRYDYDKVEVDKDIEDNLTLDSSKKAYLSQTPKGAIVVTNSAGETLTLTTDYTVVAKVVTFVTETAGSTVHITYTADVTTVVSAVETGTGAAPFKAATGVQSFTLASVPDANTLHIYANDGEVIGEGLFTFDPGTKTLSLAKEKFLMGQTVAVTYFASSAVNKTETISFESIYAGGVYNDGSVKVESILNKDSVVVGKKVIITKPEDKRTSNEAPLEYSSVDYPTFGMLANAINTDVRNGVYKVRTDYEAASTVALEPKTVVFYGGEDGLNLSKTQLFEKLSGQRDGEGYLISEGVYQLLENYSVDYIVLTGVYADDVLPGRYDMFDYELALFCAAVSHQNKTTYGYIDMTPCADTTLAGIHAYANKLASFNANKSRFLMKIDGRVYTDNNGNPIDLGKFIRVVGGPDMLYMSDTLGVHYSYNAAVVAAMQSASKPQSSLSNKKVPGSKGLRYRFSKPQLNKISGASIITFMQKFDNRGATLEGAFVVDSMTSARPGSDYVRTTTCEVVSVCVDDIRDVADPFLGEPITVEMQNALASAIAKRLGIRKEQGVILDSSFQIISNPEDKVLGRARIELTLVPPQELRELTTVVGLSPSL